MPRPTVHIIGGGLAGLAAAVRLSSGAHAGTHKLALYEAARQAGGRCRSYYDAALGLTIDNGNHLLLSGNYAVREFLKCIGNEHGMEGSVEARFPFTDLSTGESWVLHPNAGVFPWWIFVESRRVPGTKASDYLALIKLVMARGGQTIGQVMSCEGPLYERLWRPFFLAALNTEPKEGTAALAAAVTRETLMKGANACRPLVAAKGLTPTFIDPALQFLESQDTSIYLGKRVRAFSFADARVATLQFDEESVSIGPDDTVILAVPPQVAEELIPGLEVPQNFRSIVNAHFKTVPPSSTPPILGVINGLTEWIFAYPDRLSVTISGADRLLEVGREELATKIWAEVAQLTHSAAPLPDWQIIKEKRATFAATLADETRRPGPRTAYANLYLAGDWTATGLPATIEGAIRSGHRAADESRRSR